MRPVFNLPGRSALDCVASWLGDGSIGVLLTSKQYEEGFYSKREATVIATTFSAVSITFSLVVISEVGLEQMFLPFYGVVTLAGVAAAVAASRAGAKTLLIEKGVNLGGLATMGLISLYEPLCDGEGNQMVYGIAEELIKLSTCYGFDNLHPKWGGCVLKNGVELKFDTLATYPVMEGKKCIGVVVENLNGREYYEAGAVVDATGNACVMDRAGVPTVNGRSFMTYIVHQYDMEDAAKLVENRDGNAFRRWVSYGANWAGEGHPEGVKVFKESTAEEVNEYMIIGKKNLLKRMEKLGKDNFDIMMMPNMPQMRTIRRIVGKVDFNAIDGETYPDAIGWCGDFRPFGVGKHYQVPFGSMYNDGFDNLVAAGRIISAPLGNGWEVSRVIPVCAQTGEAAGKAAALCALKQVTMDEIQGKHMDQIRCE